LNQSSQKRKWGKSVGQNTAQGFLKIPRLSEQPTSTQLLGGGRKKNKDKERGVNGTGKKRREIGRTYVEEGKRTFGVPIKTHNAPLKTSNTPGRKG